MLGTLSELGFSLIPWHPAATSLSRWTRHKQDVTVTSKDAWWKSADDTRECRTGQGSCVLQSRVGVPTCVGGVEAYGKTERMCWIGR